MVGAIAPTLEFKNNNVYMTVHAYCFHAKYLNILQNGRFLVGGLAPFPLGKPQEAPMIYAVKAMYTHSSGHLFNTPSFAT